MPNEPHNEVDVFISYNRADEVWARELATRIEREKVDEKLDSRLLKVFFAPWDIDAGENIINRINDGLAKAKFVALIMSPEFFKSAWTNLEWTHLVALDPINQVRRIIPVLHRSEGQKNKNERIEPPAPFRVLNWIDFRKQHEFETQFRKLIRRIRGQRPERGGTGTPSVIASSNSFSLLHEYALPDSLPEILLSNLLPVANVPARIWSGETELTKSKEVFQVVPGADAFLLKDNRLYTFAQLTDKLCPLRKVLDTASIGTPEDRDEWLSDPDKRRSYLGLLNKCLKYELGRQRIFRDEKGRFFFPPNKNGTTRVVVHRGDRPRDVAAKKIHKDGGVFWVHYAARIRFVLHGERFFLRVEPTFFFTQDGYAPLDGKSMGRLSIQWGGKQRNVDILRTFIFWTKVLSHDSKEIRIGAGADTIKIAALPATARINFGIEGDHVHIKALMSSADQQLEEAVADMEAIEKEDDEHTNDQDDEEQTSTVPAEVVA